MNDKTKKYIELIKEVRESLVTELHPQIAEKIFMEMHHRIGYKLNNLIEEGISNDTE